MSAFLDLHVPGAPLLLANAHDAGAAKILATLGFRALATTSSGYAATLGRADMSVTRDEALTHSRAIVDAVDLPVSADLENGFALDAPGVARTVRGAVDARLAGCSIEDSTGDADAPIFALSEASERIASAVDAAGADFVLTARAENHLWGVDDLADTIERLQAYGQAGAQVLYAPGLTSAPQIRTVLGEIDRPLNVLAMAGMPSVTELADLGVARISVGGAFAYAAYAGLVDAARELLERGTYDYAAQTDVGREAARAAFG